jgi:hypothetical protein
MTGRGSCVGERGQLAGWAGQAEIWNQANSRRKKSFSNYFKILDLVELGKLCREILEELDTGIFPKIF